MNENPYTTPTATSPPENNLHEIASRPIRLLAAFIYGVIMVVLIVPLYFLFGGFKGIVDGTYQEPSMLFQLMMNLIGIIVFLLINLKFLLSNGQTVGKKIVNIRIVDMEMSKPIIQHLTKRYLLYFGSGFIPLIGGLFSLVNILFIFGADKRCLHDIFAATKVIKS